MPRGDALREVVDGFNREYGFPQCAGAVPIFLLCPRSNVQPIITIVGHSIILQGCVDNKGRFVDIYVGWPGRVHDARVFANSSLFRRGEAETLFPDWKERH